MLSPWAAAALMAGTLAGRAARQLISPPRRRARPSRSGRCAGPPRRRRPARRRRARTVTGESPPRSDVRDRGARRRPSPSDSVSPTPRSKIRARMRSGASSVQNDTFVRFGKARVVLDRRPDRRRRSSASSSSAIGDADRALRVADVHLLVAAAPRSRRSRSSRARPMSTRHVVLVRIVGRISPAAVWIENCRCVGPAAAAQVHDRLARAVARQLGLRPVGVEDPQRATNPARRRRRAPARRRRRSPVCAVAQRRHALGRQRERQRVALDDDVVVAQRLPLLEAHRRAILPTARAPRRPARDPSRRPARRPAACAATSAGAWRNCACGASSPPRRRPAARRTPAPCARVGRRAGGVRGAHLVDRAGRDHRVHARVDPRVERRRGPSSRAIRRVGWRVSLVHSWFSAGGGSSAPIASSSSARTIRWRSVGAISAAARGARRASSRVQRGSAARRDLGLPARARTSGGARRLEVEVGQCGAQVEAGPADDDRRRSLRRAARRSPRARAARNSPALKRRVDRQERRAAGARAARAPARSRRRSGSPGRRTAAARRPRPPRDARRARAAGRPRRSRPPSSRRPWVRRAQARASPGVSSGAWVSASAAACRPTQIPAPGRSRRRSGRG